MARSVRSRAATGDVANTFGARLKQTRERAGLSGSELAEETGLSQSAISRIEAGKRTPTIDTVQAIAAALKLSVSDLLGEPAQGLSDDEATLLRDFRRLTPIARDELRAYVDFLRTKHRRGASGG